MKAGGPSACRKNALAICRALVSLARRCEFRAEIPRRSEIAASLVRARRGGAFLASPFYGTPLQRGDHQKASSFASAAVLRAAARVDVSMAVRVISPLARPSWPRARHAAVGAEKERKETMSPKIGRN